ncbi:MAG: permease [Desulfobulbus propionicus]|nr:MAG: permease [Desulfobulbus propionicus]
MHLPRLPLLLYSYIASEMLAPFFASLLVLYGAFLLVRLIPLLEVVLDLRIGAADFIRLFAYIFPHMLLYVIPMACMAGIIVGVTRLTNDREILALKACGLSLRSIVPPIMLISAVIAILTAYFSVTLIPAGELGLQRLMFTLAKEKIDKGLKEKTFTEALGDLVVYVDSIDEQEFWHGVYVSDMRNRDQPIITVSRLGSMEADIDRMLVTIVLEDGTLHNAQGIDSQIIRFKRYQLQIPIRPPTHIDGDDVTTIGKPQMTLNQLLSAAEKWGRETPKGLDYLTEYHHRLVLPVGCFILGILGIPLGLQAGPGKRAVGIPLGLAFFFLYYVATTFGEIMVENLTLPLLLGMWGPNALFFLVTIYIFWRVDRERPLLPEYVNNRLADVYDVTIAALVKTLARRPGKQQDGHSAASALERPREPQLHGNSFSREFHFPECSQYDCKHCTIEFKDADIAVKAGFEPCRFCKTLLETKQTPAS